MQKSVNHGWNTDIPLGNVKLLDSKAIQEFQMQSKNFPIQWKLQEEFREEG